MGTTKLFVSFYPYYQVTSLERIINNKDLWHCGDYP